MPSLSRTLRYIARDDRHRARVQAGTRAALPTKADISYVGASHCIHNAWIKPKSAEIPNGCVAIAVYRNAHGQCFPVLVEALEGDAAAVARFRRLAHTLGATELHLAELYGTMLDRVRIERDLTREGQLYLASLQRRPLVVAGRLDRGAVKAAVHSIAAVRRSATGETARQSLAAALKGVFRLVRADLAQAQAITSNFAVAA